MLKNEKVFDSNLFQAFVLVKLTCLKGINVIIVKIMLCPELCFTVKTINES